MLGRENINTVHVYVFTCRTHINTHTEHTLVNTLEHTHTHITAIFEYTHTSLPFLNTHTSLLCSFRATLYECPGTQVQRVELRVTVSNRLEDLRKVLVASNEYSVQKLREIADEIAAWLQKVWLLCVSCHQTTPTLYT